MPKKVPGAKRPKKRKVSRYQLWKKKYPENAARHNKLRRKRRDRRDKTLWHRRLRVLMLHCGEFCTRLRDRHYTGIEVRLTVLELAKIWFRDKAWSMRRPELDREDPEGHYEFTNCRFIEKEENYARRRTAEVPAFLTEENPQVNGHEPGSEG